jgi:hypothetical protein
MLVMAALSVAAAIITVLFVAHGSAPADPAAAASPRVVACALPEPFEAPYDLASSEPHGRSS